MADIITVIGAPGSGQTTVAMRLACDIYNALKNASICVINMDSNVPALGVVFPNKKTSELASVTALLDKTDMTVENVLRSLVTAPNMKNFGYLGLKAGENRYSYPIPDKRKIEDLFTALQREFNFVIVDYSLNEEISRYALSNADRIVRVFSPDVKSMAWYVSNKHLVNDTDTRLLNVVNTIDATCCLPMEEVIANIKKVDTTLPCSKAVRQQMMNGELWTPLKDKAYNKKMATLVDKTLDPAGKGRDSKTEAIDSSGFGS